METAARRERATQMRRAVLEMNRHDDGQADELAGDRSGAALADGGAVAAVVA